MYKLRILIQTYQLQSDPCPPSKRLVSTRNTTSVLKVCRDVDATDHLFHYTFVCWQLLDGYTRGIRHPVRGCAGWVVFIDLDAVCKQRTLVLLAELFEKRQSGYCGVTTNELSFDAIREIKR